ncbi:MAG: methyltransferase domain-containing protein, partial [Verrucomicrobia bacterium]|nr:methyltransferase domain-containing protein [Verrucomicrobiota bacterium]
MCRPIFFFITALFVCVDGFSDQWSGVDYASHFSVQLSHAEHLLSNILLKGDESILDVGCEDGKITAFLARRVPFGKVVGIDPSFSMITKAKDAHHEDQLNFCEDSAEHFTFDEQFDHIITIDVMHWTKEQKTALQNMYKHLKSNGYIHLIVAPSKEGLPFFEALRKTVEERQEDFMDFVNPQQVFDMETYRKLMVEVGFQIEAIHYVLHESIHENKEKLQDGIKQWLPHGKHLPEEKRLDFFASLLSN